VLSGNASNLESGHTCNPVQWFLGIYSYCFLKWKYKFKTPARKFQNTVFSSNGNHKYPCQM